MSLQDEINRQLRTQLSALGTTNTATALLKGTGLSAPKFNSKMKELGILERAKRPSKSKPGTFKEFWKLTEKGLEYGTNQRDQREPLESSPRWFVKSFPMLVEAAKTDTALEKLK